MRRWPLGRPDDGGDVDVVHRYAVHIADVADHALDLVEAAGLGVSDTGPGGELDGPPSAAANGSDFNSVAHTPPPYLFDDRLSGELVDFRVARNIGDGSSDLNPGMAAALGEGERLASIPGDPGSRFINSLRFTILSLSSWMNQVKQPGRTGGVSDSLSPDARSAR